MRIGAPVTASERKTLFSGFSLVEMAVLMVVIGLTLAIILPRVVSSGKKDFLIEQKRAVRQARNEVIGYYRRTKSLPTDNADFQKRMGHRFDRMRLPLEYNSNSSGKLAVNGTNGNNETVAFWVASLGQNREPDSPNGNYTTDNEITLGFLAPDQNGFDDVVDYATEKYVDGLTDPGPDPDPDPEVIPDTDDYYDGTGLYQGQGNSENIRQTINISDKRIKFTRQGTKVPHSSFIYATSVSFEVDLDLQNNAILNITLTEKEGSVIFKKGLSIGSKAKIEIKSSNGYPIYIYMLKDEYDDNLTVTGDFATPPQEITSGAQTYVKIELRSGTLLIRP